MYKFEKSRTNLRPRIGPRRLYKKNIVLIRPTIRVSRAKRGNRVKSQARPVKLEPILRPPTTIDQDFMKLEDLAKRNLVKRRDWLKVQQDILKLNLSKQLMNEETDDSPLSKYDSPNPERSFDAK